jgi:hypothetical protein
MKTVKTAHLQSYGGAEAVRVEEISLPDPKPGELLVRVHTAGENPIDWKIRAGYLKQRPRARSPGRVVSSLGEQGAVRPARAAGAAGSPILFFAMAMAGEAGRSGGRRRRRRTAMGSMSTAPRFDERMDYSQNWIPSRSGWNLLLTAKLAQS